MSFDELIDDGDIIICAGTGGVGKTTTAAAIGYAAATRGRRAVVVTIDPARRLGDALGLDSLAGQPQLIDLGSNAASSTQNDGGQLWAMMLDTKATFDQLVTEKSSNAKQAARILENPHYQTLSSALSGVQEFMAMEKLHELHSSGDYDVVIVDTPPSRNALDFLDAPRNMARFLNGRLLRLVTPTGGRLTRSVTSATQVAARTVGSVIGRQVVDDTFAFIAAFADLQAGFLERSQQVEALLAAEGTSFVLVTTPRSEAVDEGRFFAGRLVEDGLDAAGLVINRCHPGYPRLDPSALEVPDLAPHVEAHDRANRIARQERTAVKPLIADVGDAAVTRVPLFETDVHDLEAIARVAGHLVTTSR